LILDGLHPGASDGEVFIGGSRQWRRWVHGERIRQEQAMMLTTPWVEQTQIQYDVQALPDDHPLTGELRELFGVHTFFVGDEGLHIVEDIEPLLVETGAREIIRLATWRDDQTRTLEVHKPELVGTVVVVAASGNR
jgi:hypothetical protein